MSRSAHPAGPRHGDVMPEGHFSAPPADLNALDPKVWSRTVARGADGTVSVGGLDVQSLAEEFGTPAYILDEQDFRARCRAWRDAFGPGADVYYAGKAFLSRAVVRWLHEEGLNVDVCSGGELTVALSAGMPAEQIAFHGNNKSVAELESAVKALEGLRTYVSVDGGMSDNIRTALYDAEYSVSLVSRASNAEPMLSRVVGKHCESGDIVVRDAFLPADLAPGDLLAVPATGAYCRSMASNYNHALKPPVIAVSEGSARVIVRRETEEDLLQLDVG